MTLVSPTCNYWCFNQLINNFMVICEQISLTLFMLIKETINLCSGDVEQKVRRQQGAKGQKREWNPGTEDWYTENENSLEVWALGSSFPSSSWKQFSGCCPRPTLLSGLKKRVLWGEVEPARCSSPYSSSPSLCWFAGAQRHSFHR